MICTRDDVTVFLRLRTSHNVDAETMATWFASLSGERLQACLCYMHRGELGRRVMNHIANLPIPPDATAEQAQAMRGLKAEKQRQENSFRELGHGTFDARGFFHRLSEWWDKDDIRKRVVAKYERDVWPGWLIDRGIKDGLILSDDDHWLALLVLGACRGLGRTLDVQHKEFLVLVQSKGWWDDFLRPDAPDAWMKVLRCWQDRAVEDMTYAQWMSLFPTIYQFSRFLPQYRNLLLSVGKGTQKPYDKLDDLLAPRANPHFDFAGQQFDAPPAWIKMGLYWVLRELVRMNVITRRDYLLSDCWVPSGEVISFLSRTGFRAEGPHNSDKAREIFEFLRNKMRTESPHLHYSFDIPLLYVARNPGLQQQLGMDT